MMRKAPPVLALLLLCTSTAAAQPSQNPYRLYVRAVVNKADSAANALQVAFEGLPSGESPGREELAKRMATASRNVRRLAGDFDAVVPPQDLSRVHGQLVQPLKDLASRLNRIAALYDITCESASMGSNCDLLYLRMQASRRAQAEIEGLDMPVVQYTEARDRLATMLKERGVELPEIKSSSSSQPD